MEYEEENQNEEHKEIMLDVRPLFLKYSELRSDFKIAVCRILNENNDGDTINLKGNLPDFYVGEDYTVFGYWEFSEQYGETFICSVSLPKIPNTEKEIRTYLSHGMIKGIGVALANRIVDKFGQETFSVISSDPEQLLQIEGISQKKLDKILKSWNQQNGVSGLSIFMIGHGISPKKAAKIYETYGEDSLSVLQNNPYQLADDIWGFGFQSVDEIAQKLDFDMNSPLRISSGVIYTMNKCADDGHCFLYRDELIRQADKVLSVGEDLIAQTIDSMVLNMEIVLDGDCFYLQSLYDAEVDTARRLSAHIWNYNIPEWRVDSILHSVDEKLVDIQYDKEQREAIRQAICSNMMILTGGPGTGKTTTLKGIITAFEQMGLDVMLAAPTGRAAKRMTEATERTMCITDTFGESSVKTIPGLSAKTLHRLLKWDGNSFQKNEWNQLGSQVLIVDESSMIDIRLMDSLLKAVPDSTRLIFVGDVDQLPSVGPGNVLKDMISSKCIPTICLTTIFRQAQNSDIVMNADNINHGKKLLYNRGKDCFFVQKDTPEEIAEEVVRLCTKNLPEYYHVNPLDDIQILSPMKKGCCGTIELNRKLQKQFIRNDAKFVVSGLYVFSIGDKVMQIKNDYVKGVYNGDIGFISKIDLDEDEIIINFDNIPVLYESKDLDELILAYAATVHKSQGSEYPIVVIPMTTTHYVMLTRNLLYTAVTRAQQILVFVGDPKAANIAIHNIDDRIRHTKLANRIQKIVRVNQSALQCA